MNKQYLIITFDSNPDFGNANSWPETFTSDWKQYYKEHQTDIDWFEVYEYDGKEFKCIKKVDEPLDEGMALYYWTSEQMNDYDNLDSPPIVEQKWPNTTRKSKLPQIVKQMITQTTYDFEGEEDTPDDCLTNLGHITWYDKDGNYWVYGEYRDTHFNVGY